MSASKLPRCPSVFFQPSLQAGPVPAAESAEASSKVTNSNALGDQAGKDENSWNFIKLQGLCSPPRISTGFISHLFPCAIREDPARLSSQTDFGVREGVLMVLGMSLHPFKC